MTRPGFEDLYKFIASLGVILVSLAILLPWLVLRESFDAGISASEISSLTLSAQALIGYRQATALWLTRNLIWISSFLAVGGILTLAAGIFLWSKKQKELDEELHYRKETQRLEFQRMNGSQIAQKAIQEVAEQTGDIQIQVPAKSLGSLIREEAVNKYLAIESTIAEKLRQCLGSDFDVITNAKVNDVGIDIVLQSKVPTLEDRIIEIKISASRFSSLLFRGAVIDLSRAIRIYQEATERRALGLLFYITLGNSVQQDQRELQMIFEKESNLLKERMQVFFFPEGYWESQPCDKIRKWILINQ